MESWWVGLSRIELSVTAQRRHFSTCQLASERRSTVDETRLAVRQSFANRGRMILDERRRIGFETPSVTLLSGNSQRTNHVVLLTRTVREGRQRLAQNRVTDWFARWYDATAQVAMKRLPESEPAMYAAALLNSDVEPTWSKKDREEFLAWCVAHETLIATMGRDALTRL